MSNITVLVDIDAPQLNSVRGLALNRTTLGQGGTLTVTNEVAIRCTGGGPYTVNLPLITSENAGMTLTISAEQGSFDGPNAITIQVASGSNNKILNLQSRTISVLHGFIILINNGVDKWLVESSNVS